MRAGNQGQLRVLCKGKKTRLEKRAGISQDMLVLCKSGCQCQGLGWRLGKSMSAWGSKGLTSAQEAGSQIGGQEVLCRTGRGSEVWWYGRGTEWNPGDEGRCMWR